ncbi:unnamed protein product [Urochloa humidicola]
MQPDWAREIREPAARIVAHLSGDIHLSQFPGALECISSLLQVQAWTKKQDGGRPKPNELILQGLIILEGLAFHHHNCRAICSTPGLVGKIMAPLSYANLMHDISNNVEWAKVVGGTFKVLHKLIQAPGKSSKRLSRAIYSNKQSMGNLGIILQHDAVDADQEDLQMGAMGILTHLALDLSINLAKETKEKLVNKLLHIFLGHGGGGREPLKEMAGKTLVVLSTNNESNSSLILTVENEIIGDLTWILDAQTTTSTYRAIAAQILENLCAHCDLDKQWLKETLLPKVLKEILSSKRLATENAISPPIDEENPQPSAPRNDEENKSSDGGNEEQTTAFLSLALVIQDKLISADDFDNAVQNEGVRPADFVAKIKTIVERNCQQETAESLRILKLCCQIAEPMMQRDHYAQRRKTEFYESVSNASKILFNLESCMLFAGTDFELQKTRP